MSETTFKRDDFLTWQDASWWMDEIITEIQDDYIILEARITFINGIWLAGISYKKRQGDLFDD